MKVACIGYRNWALNIYQALKNNLDLDFLIQKSEETYDEDEIYAFSPDVILFYGWSKIISEQILHDFTCLMLHPSDLPKYRGGSPIQNQIINGVEHSKISIFKMTKDLDAGDIVAKKSIDLTGSIDDIFKRLEEVGFELTLDILKNGMTFYPQDHSQATYFKRRTPEQSEITIDEIKNKDSKYLHNKIRMLQDPYPNAFIRTADGKKLILTNSKIEDS